MKTKEEISGLIKLIHEASFDDPSNLKQVYSALITQRSREIIFENFLDPIKLNGDEVLVNGKLVGHLENDLNDFEKGMIFTDLSGNSEEFSEIKDLYKFIVDKYAEGANK